LVVARALLDSSGLLACALAGSLCQACFSYSSLAAHREAGVALSADAYAKAVLGAASPVSPSVAAALAGCLAHASLDQVTGTLLPAMLRCLKRTPDAAIPAVATLLAAIRVDTEPLAADVQPHLMTLLRSAKDDTRAAAMRALRALVTHGSSALLASVLGAMRALLDGTSAEGRLKEVHQRVGIVMGVDSLAASPHAASAAADAVSSLAALYSADTHDDVRTAILVALTSWAPHAGNEPPGVLSTLIATALKDSKDKEGLRRAALHLALSVSRSSQSSAVNLQSAPPALLQLARGALTKATQRWDGMAALAVLAMRSAQDAQLAGAVDADKLWSVALAPGSALLRAQTMAKMNARDAVVGVDLAVALLKHHLPHVRQAGAVHAVAQQLALLMLHSSTVVAAAARDSVTNLLRPDAAPSMEVVAALRTALHAWLSLQDAQGGLYQLQEETSLQWVAATRNRAAAAIYAVAAGPLEASSGSQLLLLCAAATVQPRSGSPSRRLAVMQYVWSHVLDILERTQPGYVSSMFGADSSLTDTLLSTLRSDESVDKAVALSAIQLVAAAHPDFAFGQLLPALKAMADRTAHDSLSVTDVQVFYTPEGILLEDANKAGVFKPPVVADRNARKARGRFKMYEDDEDEEGSAPVVKTTVVTAKPAGGKPPKEDPREVARQEKLKQESLLRARVAAIKAQLEDALSALGAVARGNVERSHEQLTQLAAPVMPLLTSPLVGSGYALKTVRALANCCQWAPHGRLAGDTLATALRLCMLHAAGLSSASVENELAVIRVIQHMHAACDTRGGALETPSYAFAFPVLERVLQLPRATGLHPACCAMLAHHVRPAPGTQLPYGPTLRVLYRMIELNTLPVGVDVAPIMTDCCTGLAGSGSTDGLMLAFDGLLSPSPQARTAALSALSSIPEVCSEGLRHPGLMIRLFVAVHDTEVNAEKARAVWDRCPRTLPDTYAAEMLPLLSRGSQAVRTAAGTAMVEAMRQLPHTTQPTLARLFGFYSDCKLPDGRLEAVRVVRAAAALLTQRDLPVVCTFIIRVFSDVDEGVRTEAVTTGCAVIEAHGQAHMAALQSLFENYLQQGANEDSEMEAQRDQVRAGVVVLLGALAKHLPKEDPQVQRIVARLEEVLSVPSKAVQVSVSDCLPPLMALLDEAGRTSLLQRLHKTLTTGAKYGQRRGAAFGTAGTIKGLGISALKTYGTMDALKAAIEDKQSPLAREGALLAFECLCIKLGRLFEPYVIHILPLLLASFGDSSAGVREAAEGAANAIMGQLSAQGVKLVLPGLLKGLEDKQWRTKQGSVQLLGAMAYCQPKVLTACLPQVVPRLAETLTDTQPKVVASARAALQVVGSVIKNPEISALVPSILDAITDPNERTHACLDTLLETTFVNSIDAPSLALIIPIITRGLRERKTDLKKKAAKICGNMCALVASGADLAPYVPLLLPELKRALVDPIPEVRAIAAKALASLLHGMGEQHFTDLVPWLQQSLQSDASTAERSGAAQGLAEVLAVLSLAHTEQLLPDVVAGCRSTRACVREGYQQLLRFVPTALGTTFERHLPLILPCILDGLSDEAEGVREAAMGAGRAVVDRYARSALPLLLPAVEAGIAADGWRIRHSSVELMGELLFRVSGVTGKIQTNADGSDDEGISTETQSRLLADALGDIKRAEVLASMYLARADVALPVRQAALHVWKTLVMNTPRTLGEILPVLMQRIISALASDGTDRRTTASRCLGELVKRMAERVLPIIIPILQDGLSHPDANTRQGVCDGLVEVLDSASRQQMAPHVGTLTPAIQKALCDDSPAVRSAAGAAFNLLFRGSGGAGPGDGASAQDIVPSLLESLDPNSLEGLKQVLKAQPRLLASVLPRLVAPPLSVFHAHAVAALAEVAGPALPGHLPVMMPPLLEACAGDDEAVREAAMAAAQTVVLAVDEEDAYQAVGELLSGLEDRTPGCRAAAARLIGFYVSDSPVDLSSHTETLLAALVAHFADDVHEVVVAAWEAVGVLTGKVPKEEQHYLVQCLRSAISSAVEKERRKHGNGASSVALTKVVGPAVLLPGLCLPKGLTPVVGIYLQGVLTGSAEMRATAAEGLGELVEATSDESMKPHLVSITGPLIRIVSDKFTAAVKAAILQTLGILIRKGGAALKPFVPQLQTTFLKCLQDSSRALRMCAVDALALLMKLQTRVDPVCTELLNGLSSSASSDGDVVSPAETSALALAGVLAAGGQHVTAPILSRAMTDLQGLLPAFNSDEVVVAAARALAVTASLLADDLFDQLWKTLTAACTVEERAGRATALVNLLDVAWQRLPEATAMPRLLACITPLVTDDRAAVRDLAVQAMAAWLLRHPGLGNCAAFGSLMAAAMRDESSDVRRCALLSMGKLVKTWTQDEDRAPWLRLILQPAAEALSDASAPCKAAAEMLLYRLCKLEEGLEAAQAIIAAAGGGSARVKLSDTVLRRLQRDVVDIDG